MKSSIENRQLSITVGPYIGACNWLASAISNLEMALREVAGRDHKAERALKVHIENLQQQHRHLAALNQAAQIDARTQLQASLDGPRRPNLTGGHGGPLVEVGQGDYAHEMK